MHRYRRVTAPALTKVWQCPTQNIIVLYALPAGHCPRAVPHAEHHSVPRLHQQVTAPALTKAWQYPTQNIIVPHAPTSRSLHQGLPRRGSAPCREHHSDPSLTSRSLPQHLPRPGKAPCRMSQCPMQSITMPPAPPECDCKSAYQGGSVPHVEHQSSPIRTSHCPMQQVIHCLPRCCPALLTEVCDEPVQLRVYWDVGSSSRAVHVPRDSAHAVLLRNLRASHATQSDSTGTWLSQWAASVN